VKNLRAENERLTAELTLRLRQLMQVSTDYGQLLTAHETLRDELGQCVSENNQLTEHIAALRAELDAANKRHAEIIEQWKVEEIMWRDFDKQQLAEIDALRAELDAMRQAHSVIAARMAAMGC
jgi:regulator of replication initiation timing